MAKKKFEDNNVLQDIRNEAQTPKLTAAEYWEWRNSCTELWLEKARVKLADSESQVLKQDVEIAKMRFDIHRLATLKCAKEELLNAEKSYLKIKEVIEANIGVSLNDKVIDDLTFEVKDAPKV